MRILYHYPLCPFSRKVRLSLAEKKLDFSLEKESFWEKRAEFLNINPLGQVPVMIDLNGSEIADSIAITEYLEEAYPERSLLGDSLIVRAEVRRLVMWFDSKFATEVSLCLLYQKAIKRFICNDSPDSALIRAAKQAIHRHLDYISWLADRRNWLGGDNFSLADITIAAHLSVVDYFGDIPWDKHEPTKQWYARIKSRPSFRAFFQDRIPGILPSEHYQNLDF